MHRTGARSGWSWTSADGSGERANAREFRNAGAIRRRRGVPDDRVGEQEEAVTDRLAAGEAERLLAAGLAEEPLAGPDHYLRAPNRIRRGTGLYVLALTGDRICAMTRFEASVLPWFGLPRSLPGR